MLFSCTDYKGECLLKCISWKLASLLQRYFPVKTPHFLNSCSKDNPEPATPLLFRI